MSKQKYTSLIVLVCVALIGSIAVQARLIYNGYEQSKQHLHDGLAQALQQTIDAINQDENLAIVAAFSDKGHGAQVAKSVRHVTTSDSTIEINEFVFDTIIRTDTGSRHGARAEAHVRMEYRSDNDDDSTNVELRWSSDSAIDKVLMMQRNGTLSELLRQVQVEEWVERGSWKDRVNLSEFEEEFEVQLRDLNISLKPEIAMVNEAGAVLDGFATANFKSDDRPTSVTARAFPNDLKDKDIYVQAQVASMSHVLADLWMLILAALTFTSLMVILFVVVIKKLMSQARLSELKTDFINNMSHELKTPLATISLAADSLEHPSVADRQEKVTSLAKVIRKEQQRMHEHIDRVLVMAQSSSGKFILNRELTSLETLLNEVLEGFNLQLNEANVKLKLDIIDAEIFVDQLHMKSAIGNVLDNAIKYRKAAPQIEVETQILRGMAIIRVIDNGIGLSETDRQLVFDRFHRVQTGDTHTVKGFGLGLTYVRTVVEAHGGNVLLHGKENLGCTVEIRIPIHGQ